MKKKTGSNIKAEVARARRAAAEAERLEREARAKEEQYWQAAEGPKSRAARRRGEEAEKRAEAAARRAENRRLADLEQQQLAAAAAAAAPRRPGRKASLAAAPSPRVTAAELLRLREEEQLRLRREAEAAEKRQARTADEREYERVVLVANTNRDDSIIEARSVQDAIAKMSTAAKAPLPLDRHPERRLKGLFKAFQEAELAKLKEEKPGLTLNQYTDMVSKIWKRSPENPRNQVADRTHLDVV